ncbi:MAG TPA: RnfABCDGE type electron transport complex subunit B [Candidatus Hydrogenedentes bacterium]|nr:MAG: Electron transport complex protein rnfB [Candidatus Hydrogenedentes bacterium ADurb.Bin179]HOH28493.1 RnfABCDGE type electron transport complex subunit B [Candidatus Hydrogenedentota bacterium]
MTGLLIAGGAMLVLGLLLSGLLALANTRLYVHEDPRIDVVESMLPSANCGACGHAGCRAFAEAVVAGSVSPGKCTVSSPEAVEAIASYMGVAAQRDEKRVARLACAGGDDMARRFAHYEGRQSCRAAALVAGGGKSCTYGCLGYGDCARACKFDAIHLNKNNLPVVDEEKCTACGACVAECPKHLYSIHPVSHHLWVACSTHMRGKDAKESCLAACIGCGMCAKTQPEVISMNQNLPVIDYSKNGMATPDAIQRCPSGAIVWLEPGGKILYGAKALEGRMAAGQAPEPKPTESEAVPS